ncbi:uncharacterized protein LOC125016561 isoform X2 [Mugil cephalus]|uniref:uncharacterized protein LOC125016561 isoform X2 n=1 Tax=Mugil cephalus TaxID=48193 RepID=UPI001FB71044|nr:uncharacterized protein LOC125016561 isoform X2 [Mugil cephalus]
MSSNSVQYLCREMDASLVQKDFIFSFLLILCNLSPSTGHAENHLHFYLGCEAVIPCQHNRNSDSFKWIYKKDEHSDKVQIFFQSKNGLHLFNSFYKRGKVMSNRSLLISHFTEDDQGLYWCESCSQDVCGSEQSAVIRVKKGILTEISMTVYVTAGSHFEHTCPGEHVKWTFEASNHTTLGISGQRRETDYLTFNKTIHIGNVTEADAGKYICWARLCDKYSEKLLTINLCVITVRHSAESPVSCAVLCGVESNNPNGTEDLVIGPTTISLLVDLHGSLSCTAKIMFDRTTTVTSSHVFQKTTDIPTEPGYLMPVVHGVLAALAFLILMALLISVCHFRSRLRAAFPVHILCGRLNSGGEEDVSVVYSSVVIRTPAKKADVNVSPNECIYSEINPFPFQDGQ